MSNQSLSWPPIFLAAIPILLGVIGLMSVMSDDGDGDVVMRRTSSPVSAAAPVAAPPSVEPVADPASPEGSAAEAVEPAEAPVLAAAAGADGSARSQGASTSRRSSSSSTSGSAGEDDRVRRGDLRDLQDAAFGRMTNRCRRLLERGVNAGEVKIELRRRGGGMHYEVKGAAGPLPEKLRRCIEPSCDSPSYECDL
ncbi:MAG: hypothetical protein KTR31_04080 [Myxococcales bacterium]|nr:hypothetical protein [Myxococcales bacterium]